MAIIGAGYVGMPLARVFADAGKVVVLVDVDREVVDGINRGESHIPDVSSDDAEAARRFGARIGDDGLRRAEGGRRDPDRTPDAALEPARAGPLHRQGRGGRDRAASAQGSARRARVDDVPGDDARVVCSRSSSGAGSRPARTSISRSRPSASIRGAPTGRRRTRRRWSVVSRRRAPSARRSSTALQSTPSSRSPRRRRRR